MPANDQAGTTTTSKRNRGTPAASANRLNDQAALPPGTLRGPHLGRQGDEHRQPSTEEMRRLADVRSRLRRGEKA